MSNPSDYFIGFLVGWMCATIGAVIGTILNARRPHE